MANLKTIPIIIQVLLKYLCFAKFFIENVAVCQKNSNRRHKMHRLLGPTAKNWLFHPSDALLDKSLLSINFKIFSSAILNSKNSSIIQNYNGIKVP